MTSLVLSKCLEDAHIQFDTEQQCWFYLIFIFILYILLSHSGHEH